MVDNNWLHGSALYQERRINYIGLLAIGKGYSCCVSNNPALTYFTQVTMLISTFWAALLLLGQSLLREPLSPPPSGFAAQPPLRAPHAVALFGQVINERGAPLPGVIIAVQGAATVASTNADGRFLIAAPVAEPVLVFKCAGYRVQTVLVPAASALTVTMYTLTGTGADKATTAERGALAEASAAPVALLTAEVMPKFVGSDNAYADFLREHAVYPAEALKKHVGGKVYVTFVIDEQGRVCEAEVLKGCGYGLDEEALRLVRLMPWWQPGQTAGRPVRIVLTRAITFEARWE